MYSGDLTTSTVEGLKAKHDAIRNRNDLTLRTHRAIRWFQRAAKESQDADVAFILCWIAFNAAYGKDVSRENNTGERALFADYFDQLTRLDRSEALYNAIWDKFAGPVKLLLKNRYLYGPFWNHLNGRSGIENWETRFARDRVRASKALERQNTKDILTILFDRLYTLRNQLVHGGATWNSSMNRDSVRDGASIMEFLVPVCIGIMLDNPDEDWGPPYYPPGLQGGDRGRGGGKGATRPSSGG